VTKRTLYLLLLLLLSLAALVPPAWCAVTVVDELGPTQPLAPLLDAFGERETRPDPPASKQRAGDPAALLPIRSPGLSPGVLQSRAISLPLTRPVFLIGADAESLQWLTDHHQQLTEMGAIGMLVQADTLDDLAAVAAAANGLSILPASASDIAAALQISVYPVLISRDRIKQ
jgi:integrating conjugative element protein (TIGR03765 family)